MYLLLSSLLATWRKCIASYAKPYLCSTFRHAHRKKLWFFRATKSANFTSRCCPTYWISFYKLHVDPEQLKVNDRYRILIWKFNGRFNHKEYINSGGVARLSWNESLFGTEYLKIGKYVVKVIAQSADGNGQYVNSTGLQSTFFISKYMIYQLTFLTIFRAGLCSDRSLQRLWVTHIHGNFALKMNFKHCRQ